MARSMVGRLLGAALRAVVDATSTSRTGNRRAGGSTAPTPRPAPGPAGGPASRPAASTATGPDYPGDFRGLVTPRYAPDLDGDPDPGEIVWTWVPYEEDHSRGKDRPVLLVGRDGDWLLGLMLSSRDHDTRPAPADEQWFDLGTGDWDTRRRPSEVRLDRVIRIDPQAVRREGAVLDRARFDEVAGSLRARGA